MSFDFLGGLFSGIGNIAGTYMANQQSAENSENQAIWNAQEAARSRDFNANQADLNRQFQHNETVDQRVYNSTEALANRMFQGDQADVMRAYNAREAQTARDWIQSMSSSAYQRATADMRAAGINPMLAYLQGGASSPGGPAASSGSPSGSQASSSAPSGSAASSSPAHSYQLPVVKSLTEGSMSSALEVMKTLPLIKNMEEQNKNLQAERDRTDAETQLTNARSKTELETADNKRVERENLWATKHRLDKEATESDIERSRLESKFGEWTRRVGSTFSDVAPIAGTANAISEMFRRSVLNRRGY